MKQGILTLLFSTMSLLAFGQARLGSSVEEIKAEFWEDNYNLKSGYDSDGDYFIHIETERAAVTYYFSSDKICTSTFIAPKNQGALNFYVELYNDQYVIISPTEWKMYSSDGIASVKLIYPEGGGYFFLWK
jgi:hypothetical protein